MISSILPIFLRVLRRCLFNHWILIMDRHTALAGLITSLTAKEKSDFLKREHAQPVESKLVNLLFNDYSLRKTGIAKKLKLSEKKYKKLCECIYRELSRFLLSNKGFLENDIQYSLRETQLMAELLKEKGLIKQALKKIEIATETALHYELFHPAISLQRQYLQIASYQHESAERDKVLPLVQQIENNIDLQREQDKLHLIYYQLITLRYKMALRTSPEEQEEVKQLYARLLEFPTDGIRTNTICIYYYQSSLLTAFMLGWTENIGNWNCEVLQCWQEKSHLISIHPELFIRSASLQAYTHFLLKDINSAKAYLEQYRDLATNHLSSAFHKDWFAIVDFQTTIKLLHKTYQYEKVDSYFSKNWPVINPLFPVLSEAEKLDILISVGITFFVLQQWENAEEIIQEVKSVNQKIKRLDTLYFTFVFHCLILYEQKEWARLDNMINSEYHFLYSNQALRPFEKDMLLFIKKLPLAMFKGKAEESMKDFLKKLDAYRDNNMQRLHFATFDFYSWVESKIEGVPYSIYMKKKSLQQV